MSRVDDIRFTKEGKERMRWTREPTLLDVIPNEFLFCQLQLNFMVRCGGH